MKIKADLIEELLKGTEVVHGQAYASFWRRCIMVWAEKRCAWLENQDGDGI